MVKAECKVKNQFYDKECNNELRINGKEFVCNFERAKYLAEHNAVEIIKVYDDEKIEEKEEQEEKEEKPKRTRKKKTI